MSITVTSATSPGTALAFIIGLLHPRSAPVIIRSMCHCVLLSPSAIPLPDASSTSSAVCQSLPESRTSDQYEERERRGREERDKTRSPLKPPFLLSPTLISRQNPRLLCMKKIESSRRRRRRQYHSLFGVPCLDGSKLIPLEDRPLPFTSDPQISLTFYTSLVPRSSGLT